MISRDSNQNSRLHTGAHVNVVLLTYLNDINLFFNRTISNHEQKNNELKSNE